ncbi:MAG: hypothetical protein JRI96_16985, partial [Deltaproteobacteria bacterium]|nr:hypothetical protein [Deltaproteobacteria bacterium]
ILKESFKDVTALTQLLKSRRDFTFVGEKDVKDIRFASIHIDINIEGDYRNLWLAFNTNNISLPIPITKYLGEPQPEVEPEEVKAESTLLAKALEFIASLLESIRKAYWLITSRNLNKKAYKKFSRIDQDFLMKIKDIFLNSQNVYDDFTAFIREDNLKGQFDGRTLRELFPAMVELKDKNKYGTLSVYDHTLFMIQLAECIEKNDMEKFNEDKAGWQMKGAGAGKLFGQYHSLFKELTRNGQDKEARALLYFIVLFHDMGEAIDKQKHHPFGAGMAEKWLGQAGFSDEAVKEARGVIFAHVDVGGLFVSLRTPGYLQSDKSLNVDKLEEAVKLKYLKVLGLLTLIDVRSFNDGRFIDAGNTKFYLDVGKKGFLDKLARGFFDFRVKTLCSTPAHDLLPEKYAQAQEGLKEVEAILGDDYKDFQEAFRAEKRKSPGSSLSSDQAWVGIEVINYYDYFSWGMHNGHSLIKMWAIIYRLAKEKKISWIEFITSSGEGEVVGSLVEEHILNKVSYEDILYLDAEGLIAKLAERGLEAGYALREGQEVVKIEVAKLYQDIGLEAVLSDMLEECLHDAQAPPIKAEIENGELKIAFSGNLPQLARDYPQTSVDILRKWIKSKRLKLQLIGNTSPKKTKALENCKDIPFKQRKAWRRLNGIGGMFPSLINVEQDKKGDFNSRQRHVLRGLEAALRYAQIQGLNIDESLIKKIAVAHQLGRLPFVHFVEGKLDKLFPNLKDIITDKRYNQPIAQDIIYKVSGISLPDVVSSDLDKYLLNKLDEVTTPEARVFFLADKILGYVEDFVLAYKLTHNNQRIIDDFEGRDEFLEYVFGSKDLSRIEALAIEDFDEFVVKATLALMKRVIDKQMLKIKKEASGELDKYRDKYEKILFPRVAETGASQAAENIFAAAKEALMAKQASSLSDQEKERNVFEKMLTLTENEVLKISRLKLEGFPPELNFSQDTTVSEDALSEVALGSLHITVDLGKFPKGIYPTLVISLFDDKGRQLLGRQSVAIKAKPKEKPEAAKDEQIKKLCQELNIPFNKAYLSYSKETLERRVKSLIEKGIAPQDITPILIRYQGYLDTIEENDTSTSHKKKLISNAKKEISGLRQKIKRLTDKEKKP